MSKVANLAKILSSTWFGHDLAQGIGGDALRGKPTRTVDPLRHLEVFDPLWWGDRPISIIGAGATGSKVAHNLAKLGVNGLHVWDFDTVAEHNIANQDFFMGHVGELKVNALREIVAASTGIEISIYPVAFEPTTQVEGSVVFLLVDSMKVRKEIWESALRWNPSVSLVIETRMGADQGRVYALNPCDPDHITEYEATYYSDEEATVSACGASVTVGPTAEIIASMAIWKFIRWAAIERGRGNNPLENETIISLDPMAIMARQFGK